MSDQMNTAELLVKCLQKEGVDTVFGLPGEENSDFVIAMKRAGLKLILTRHEQGAAFMADCYGRLTGRPGVCLGTLGPGATNLVTGVADANMDCAPLIVITGQAGTYRLHKESHQNMDVCAMFDPITKWSVSIVDPGSVTEIVRKAFKLAQQEKPGACHIELPEDIAKLKVPKEDCVPLPVEKIRRSVPDDKIVDRAWSIIAGAKRPIILAGNGAVRKLAAKQLRQFVAHTGMGVVNTFMAKGLVDMNSDQCLFTVGLGQKDFNNKAIDEADLVICLGFQLVEYHAQKWNAQRNKRIIHADFHQAEVDRYYQPEVELVGDLSHTLWMLNERAAAHKDEYHYDFTGQAAIRRLLLDDFAEHKDDDTRGSIRPQKVLWDIREAMGPHDILLSDVGAHKMWIARHFHANEPNTVLISNGFCSMGFALPGAMGASLACPGRKIVAVCGDGGFLMNVQEMETAKRYKMPIVVVVWEDKAYGLIEWKQDNEHGEHTELSFENPDFVQLAAAFGWKGHYVKNARDFLPTMKEALEQDGPVLIALTIDYSENPKLTEKLGKIACPL